MIFPVALQASYDLQAEVRTAIREGRRRLQLPKGTHRLPATGDSTLDLEGVDGFEIAGEGTTLLVTRPDQGFGLFRRCRGLRLTGFTVRHETPSMTQGVILSVSPDRSTYEVEMMPGFLAGVDDLPEDPVGYIFEPKTLRWRKGSGDLYFSKRTSLGGHRLRFETGYPVGGEVRVGDYMAFRGKGRQNLLFEDCPGTRVEGITLQSSPGFGIQESGGEGGSVFRYRVLRGPKPAGASVVPLLSANADAFHSNGVRKGPILENCRFEWMPDDGVPIHGYYFGVASSSPRRVVVTAQWGGEWFRAGDRLRIYAREGRATRTPGERESWPRVTSVRTLEGFAAPESPYPPLRGKPHQYEIELDRDVPGLAVDDLVANVDAQGNGYIVRNNVIRDHRARGMLLTADDGLVENNVIDGSTIAGIVLCPELYWMQSDFSHGVTIRNNVIRNVSYATVGPGSSQVGGIVVTAELPPGTTGARYHRKIRIEGNRFERISGPALVIRHAAEVTERRNRFRDLLPSVNGAGRDHGFPASGERFIEDADVNR